MMRWGPGGTVDAQAEPTLALAHPGRDAYFDWALVTRWRGFRRLLGQPLGTGTTSPASLNEVRVLVRALSQDAMQRALGSQAWPFLQIAPIYREAFAATHQRLRHFTATVQFDDLPALQEIDANELVWELALPFRDADTVARAQPVGAYGETRQAAEFKRQPVFAEAGLKAAAAGAWQALQVPAMAVIDFGCPFMNEAFVAFQPKGPGHVPRLHFLWDQGATAHQAPWGDAQARWGAGRFMGNAEVRAVMRHCVQRVQGGQPLDEPEAYAALDYLIDYDDPRRRVWRATHGSHVLSVAAGRTDPLMPLEAEEDCAAVAPLVFVQLPTMTAADSGGGSLSAQVLDALHAVRDCAPKGAVVTLSYGSLAGPHDGSSLIETAMDELMDACEGKLQVVLGAGNSRQAAGHAHRTLRVNRSALLRVGIPPGDFTDTFVELWFACERTEPSLAHVRLRVRTPAGDWSGWVGVDEAVVLSMPGDDRPAARLSFQRHTVLGAKPMALLALAPTSAPADDDGPLSAVGEWHLELDLGPEAGSDAALNVDAYIERDDPGWLGFGVQARFLEQRLADGGQTLSSLASGANPLVAGGFRLSDGRPAAYSATGSRKAGAPIGYAACEESALVPSVRGAAVRSGESLRMNGTSVAAPVLARCLFNWLMTQHSDDWSNAPGGAELLTCVIGSEQAAAQAEGRPSKLREAVERPNLPGVPGV